MRTPLLCALVFMCSAGLVHGQPGYLSPNAAGQGLPYPGYYYGANHYGPNAGWYQAQATAPAAPAQGGAAAGTGAPGSTPAASVSAACVEEPASAAGDPPTKHRFWVNASYAAVFIQQEKFAVPLLTTGSVANANPGAIGQPNTVIRSPNELNFGMLSGLQADAGVFLEPDGCVALQWSGLFVIPGHQRYSLASDGTGNPLIARPVFNANAGLNQAIIDTFPGSVRGSFNLDSRSEFLGTEANLIYRWSSTERSHFDVLGGFRYLHLAEDLTMIDQLTPLVPGFLTYQTGAANPPNSLADMDKFQTSNNYYGFQLGGLYAIEKNRWFLSAYGKTGLGVTNQFVNVFGQTALITPTGRQFAGGGVLALPSNMGQYSRNVFGFVPEAGFTLGFNLTDHLQLTAGYSVLYWNSVVRPGGQLNASVNPTQIPTTAGFGTATGPSTPQFQFVPETFWLQNINAGITLHF